MLPEEKVYERIADILKYSIVKKNFAFVLVLEIYMTAGKGVLSIGVLILLVGNRVGVGLARSTIRHLFSSYFPFKGASK